LFESIQGFHVLTVDKRYFDIPGSVERWIYLYARKSTGGPTGIWTESFKSLHKKSASQQEYKHYAYTLRKLIGKNNLPGLSLGRKSSPAVGEMLVMERTEKRTSVAPKEAQQLPLVEQSPLEEAWENAFGNACKQLGTSTANSWLKPLRLRGLDAGILTFVAPTKFIADWVSSHYLRQLCSAWKDVGYDVEELRIEVRPEKSAA
jgi:hypothetical protein